MTKTETMPITNEMIELQFGLDQLGIPYDLHACWDGWQITCKGWDAIWHSGSYGHEQGLLEVMGSIVHDTDDDVEGYLTASEILSRLQ